MRSWFFSSFFSPPSSSASPFLSISLTAEESLTAALKKRKGRHDGAIRLYTAQTGTTNHGRGKKPKKKQAQVPLYGVNTGSGTIKCPGQRETWQRARDGRGKWEGKGGGCCELMM